MRLTCPFSTRVFVRHHAEDVPDKHPSEQLPPTVLFNLGRVSVLSRHTLLSKAISETHVRGAGGGATIPVFGLISAWSSSLAQATLSSPDWARRTGPRERRDIQCTESTPSCFFSGLCTEYYQSLPSFPTGCDDRDLW